MNLEYYITAIKISTTDDGYEYISHVKAHARVGDVIKKQGQKFEKDFVISMMAKANFYTAKKDDKGKWKHGSAVTVVEGEDDLYLEADLRSLKKI